MLEVDLQSRHSYVRVKQTRSHIRLLGLGLGANICTVPCARRIWQAAGLRHLLLVATSGQSPRTFTNLELSCGNYDVDMVTLQLSLPGVGYLLSAVHCAELVSTCLWDRLLL
jgi:hypothetical protein